ncbi:MAG: putative membrane protein [Gammaproteobacteria bacterium]|jgi:uncharacterized membrane protein
MNIAVMLHVMAVVIWVGGMFFAYMALRPVAASQLEPPVRLKLWVGVFGRFFPWVWASIVTLLVTGFMIIGFMGGIKGLPMHISVMMMTGIIMMLIFLHMFFGPYRRLKLAVAAEDWPTGGSKLAQIRVLVGINTIIGLLTIAVRYLV